MTAMDNCSNQSRRLAFIASALVLISIVTTAAITSSCSPGGRSGEPESITFGDIPSGSAALVYIAQERGFFRAEGLSVSLKDYPTGVATTDALLTGEVDIAWSAEFPMVSRAFSGEKISVIAVSGRFSDEYLFGLKDHGIDSVSDIKGKTIGVPVKTIAEFYLSRFLLLSGVNTEEVSLVNVLPPQSEEATTDGSVDGVVTWEPYTNRIKEQLADRIVAWPIQSSQPGFGVIIGRNDWLSESPQVVEQFLESLARAEEYLVRNPEAAKDIVQERLGYDDKFMEIFWPENQFYLSLDQALITAMEDEARWMIDNNLTDEKQVPDFLDYIYMDALEAIKPEAVNIIY